MKKIVYIISLLSLLIAGVAYTVNETLFTEPVKTTVGYDESYFYYTGITSDTIGVGDSVYVFPVRKKSLSTLIPYVYLSLDSVGGTANIVTVTLESKVFEQESYTPRETVIWHDGSDTTIIMVSDTAHISEYWRVKLSGADDTFKAKLLRINFKFAQ